MLHEPADEMDVPAQAVELGDGNGTLTSSGLRKGGGKLGRNGWRPDTARADPVQQLPWAHIRAGLLANFSTRDTAKRHPKSPAFQG